MMMIKKFGLIKNCLSLKKWSEKKKEIIFGRKKREI